MSDISIVLESRRLGGGVFENPGLRMKVFADPNYFVPDPDRTRAYLYLDRHQSTFTPDFLIPLGCNDEMRYFGEEEGGGE